MAATVARCCADGCCTACSSTSSRLLRKCRSATWNLKSRRNALLKSTQAELSCRVDRERQLNARHIGTRGFQSSSNVSAAAALTLAVDARALWLCHSREHMAYSLPANAAAPWVQLFIAAGDGCIWKRAPVRIYLYIGGTARAASCAQWNAHSCSGTTQFPGVLTVCAHTPCQFVARHAYFKSLCRNCNSPCMPPCSIHSLRELRPDGGPHVHVWPDFHAGHSFHCGTPCRQIETHGLWFTLQPGCRDCRPPPTFRRGVRATTNSATNTPAACPAPLRLSVYNNPGYQNSNINSKDKDKSNKLGSCLDPTSS
jgi:hypothetical protein